MRVSESKQSRGGAGEERRGGEEDYMYLGFCDLQITDLDSAGCEVGDLELDLDRPLAGLGTTDTAHAAAKTTRHATARLVVTSHAGQAQLGAHEKLLVAAKLLDLPDDGALLGGVVDGADVGAEARGVGIVGDGDDDLDVVGGGAALELGLGLEKVLDTGARVGLDGALDPDEGLDLGVEAVGHELELAVRGDEGYRAVILEAGESDALVELDVLHLDGLAAGAAARRLEHDLVVEAEPQLGHAAEVALHLDGAQDLGPEDVAVGRDKQVEALDDVEEDLVLAVPDALGAPRDGVGHGDWRACLDLELVRLLSDVLLQDLSLGRLRVAKVHHLIKELVDDDEVVADRLLLEDLEVLGEDLDQLVEEEEDLGGVGVALGEGEDVEVVVADVEVLWEGKEEKGVNVLGSVRF